MVSPTINNATLQAEYKSPNDEVTFSHDLGVRKGSSSDQSSAQDRTTYLNALRASVTKLQDEVNVLLTKKMDEDKGAAAAGIADAGKSNIVGVDDEKEEENYGEEVVDEDD
jgi:hypothetical protein